MCAAKSPISILQELTVMKHLPFPQYSITYQGSGFKCIGSVGILSASAVAESKKRAKHLCAEHILQLLESEITHTGQYNNVPTISVERVATNPVIQVEEVLAKAEEPKFNAVGKLNEVCSQNGIPYPSYEDVGIVEQKFLIKCKLQSQVTQGQASTKKQAKQMAAKEMLSRLSSPGFCDVIKYYRLDQKSIPEYHIDVQEKLIQVIKHRKQPQKVQTNRFSQTCRDLLPNLELEELNLDESKVVTEEHVKEHVSEKKLREELQKLNIAFRVYEFQTRPFLILVLRTLPTMNHIQYTFMHSAATYRQAIIGLLEKAVRDIKLMEN